MKVLFVAAEAAPLVKVGGLGDVAGSLPPAVKNLGVDIRVAIPWYPEIDTQKWKVAEKDGVGVCQLGNSGVTVYLLAREVFSKSGEHKAILDTEEEEVWFGNFSRAVVDFIKQSAWKPEVLHGNDWHVAEALAELEKASAETLAGWGYGKSGNLATILTIHNLSYHTGVLKKAIQAADIINAVSPTYGREILTEAYCEGLCGELRAREKDIYGVLNGIDYSTWDPAGDENIEKFSRENFAEGKRKNKEKLAQRLGFKDKEALLMAFVGRLDPHQKGVWVLHNALGEFAEMGINVVILGTGHPKAERVLAETAGKYPGRIKALIKYDEQLAHQIYAGSDALLVPSRFEPCGLIQMIGMRYGTLPVAHAVGGLIDSIEDGKTGFLYKDYYRRGLVRAVRRVRQIYDTQRGEWEKMAAAAMGKDFSWDSSAREYVKLYEQALGKSK